MSEAGYMSENEFWNLIDVSLAGAEALSAFYEKQQNIQIDALLQAMRYLNPEEVISFQNRLNQFFFQLDTSHVACAGYIMSGGFDTPEDFDAFRYWLISRGETVFHTVLHRADDLSGLVNSQPDFRYGFADFVKIAPIVFERQTARKLEDYVSYDDYSDAEELDWDEDDAQSLRRICPRLFAQYWRG